MAILSGQRSDNGFSLFAPGGIRIGTDMGVFGIEVGGGHGDNPLPTALGGGVAGSIYALNGSGYTVGHAYSTMTTGLVWFRLDTGSFW